jgi:hypothetical protein
MIFVHIGAGAGDLDSSANFKDGFSGSADTNTIAGGDFSHGSHVYFGGCGNGQNESYNPSNCLAYFGKKGLP